jgi:hypothetical protein
MFTFPAIFDGMPDFFPGLAGALLDAADQLIFLALHELEVIIRKLRKLLLELAHENIPVSFGSKRSHINQVFDCWFASSHPQMGVEAFLCKRCADLV